MHPSFTLVGMLLAAPGEGGGGGGSPFQILVPVAIIFMIFFLLVLRPQKRKEQERQALLAALKKGDTVYTSAGILGKIKALDEREVTLEIDKKGASLRVLRQTIGGRYEKSGSGEPKLDAPAESVDAMVEPAKT